MDTESISGQPSSSLSDSSQDKCQDSFGICCRRRDGQCKVVGCSVDLSALNKPYCVKRGVCPEHLKAEAVKCKGAGEQLWRFCQQCGKMERLQMFSGKNRSCQKGSQGAGRRPRCGSSCSTTGSSRSSSCRACTMCTSSSSSRMRLAVPSGMCPRCQAGSSCKLTGWHHNSCLWPPAVAWQGARMLRCSPSSISMAAACTEHPSLFHRPFAASSLRQRRCLRRQLSAVPTSSSSSSSSSTTVAAAVTVADDLAAPMTAAADGVASMKRVCSVYKNQAAQYAKLHALEAQVDGLKVMLQQLQQAQGVCWQSVGSVATQV
ncbi:hypothetical protein COO60DRAFT_706206 [Scenedesmus sp. NREL 46B-D3]|nr:hypothetical protein COO60DRAFT_706206 [Scenedesmus sp. NREL 46B-D3]